MVDYVVEDPCRAQVQERRQKTETEACQAEKTHVEDGFRSCRSNRGSPEEAHFPRRGRTSVIAKSPNTGNSTSPRVAPARSISLTLIRPSVSGTRYVSCRRNGGKALEGSIVPLTKAMGSCSIVPSITPLLVCMKTASRQIPRE